MMRVACVATLAVGLVLLTGCGGTSKGNSVSGNVNFKGKPLGQGTIIFSPGDETTQGFGQAEIKDGKFSIPASAGLAPGTYVVRVTAPDPKYAAKEEPLPGDAPPAAKDLIPAEFNENSRKTFEVKAGENGVFNWDIP